MIPLCDIDPNRVKEVRNGTISYRGCGKTTSKLVTLLSYIREYNDQKRYIFVGENINHLREIHHIFVRWVRESGCMCDYAPASLIAKVILPLNQPKNGMIDFMGKLFGTSHDLHLQSEIYFYFKTPDMLRLRGQRYNGMIIDLTPEKYYDNYKTIKEAEWAITK